MLRRLAPALLTDQERQYAPWLADVAAGIDELLGLEANWDSYGAITPTRVAAGALLEILIEVTSPNTPRPVIVPSPAGHFQAEWHENGIDLEIEVISRTQIDVLFESAADSWNLVFKGDLSLLVEAVDQLSG